MLSQANNEKILEMLLEVKNMITANLARNEIQKQLTQDMLLTLSRIM